MVKDKKMRKKVYVGMCADIIHAGHLNIIKEAQKLGNVVVGVLTDEAVASYKRIPTQNFESRKMIMENIKGVEKVVPQRSLSYKSNLMNLRPDFVVHGDDWLVGKQQKIRKEVLNILKEWGGTIIDVPYTSAISSTILNEKIRNIGVTPDQRRRKLNLLINNKEITRVIETHNGLTGIIAEKIQSNGREFDAMWLSSLTHSASKGKPDIQYVDITLMSQTIGEIFDVSTKPMIVDADNGGLVEHFKLMVKTLERLGVSAVIIEDKTGLKKNSLFGTDASQQQDSIENFADKIAEGKKVQVSKEFMIISRIESLILRQGVQDALQRANAYVVAGADAIMIHSKEDTPDEIKDFISKFRKKDSHTPIVVVPTTYDSITENELKRMGVGVVIYANHFLRSAYPAMRATAKSILDHGRSLEANEMCMPIKEIINLIKGE